MVQSWGDDAITKLIRFDLLGSEGMRVANSSHNEVGMGSKREVAGFYEVMDWLLAILVKASSVKCEHSLLFVGSFGSNTHVVAGGDLGDFPMRMEEVDFFS
ncbi:hypothetical protein [Pseudomonas sp. S2_H01]